MTLDRPREFDPNSAAQEGVMPETKNVKQALQRELETLAKARDELQVNVSLAKAEIRDEWRRLETSWGLVETELKRIGEHSKESVRDMGAAARSLVDELKQGYARVKEQLKEARHQKDTPSASP
jgi:chromosome segregation ATPase